LDEECQLAEIVEIEITRPSRLPSSGGESI
jgi:hypothetical protein